MLAWYDYGREFLSDFQNSRITRRKLTSEINIIIFHFLKAVGLFSDGLFNEAFLTQIENGSINLSKSNLDKPHDPRLQLSSVFVLSLMGQIESLEEGLGAPGNLIVHGAHMADIFFRKFHPIEWKRANQRFMADQSKAATAAQNRSATASIEGSP